MQFEEALIACKNGKAIKRKYWGLFEFAVMQKGYPQGIKCNEQTAKAWGMRPGDNFCCEPYLQKQVSTGMGLTHVMWVPSTEDIFADDWMAV